MTTWKVRIACGLLTAAGLAVVAQQRTLPTPQQGITNNFRSVNRRLLDMAKDFPEDKYSYRPSPEVRSFGEVILHAMAGNTFAAKVVRGVPDANWDKEEVDPKNFKNKAEIVAAFQKSVDEANAELAKISAEQWGKTLAPWLAVIEHSGEHYGQLVVYYRLNKLVPPESRPKK